MPPPVFNVCIRQGPASAGPRQVAAAGRRRRQTTAYQLSEPGTWCSLALRRISRFSHSTSTEKPIAA